MNTTSRNARTRFVWNAGGWFGAQIGCTAWLFLLGAFLLRDDPGVGAVALGGGVLLQVLGVVLWRARATLPAYTAFQTFFGALTVVLAVLVVIANTTTLATPVPSGHAFAEWLPWWTIAIPVALMATFAMLQRHE